MQQSVASQYEEWQVVRADRVLTTGWSNFGRVRRETGKEQRVQVPCREGIANHTGPESCAAYREVRISAIVDACFRLIVDGESVLPRRRWGSAQELL